MKHLAMIGLGLLILFGGSGAALAQQRGMGEGGMMGPGQGGMMGPGMMGQGQERGPQPQATGAESGRGKTLYENNCAECHGATGRGDGPAAAALGSTPPDFTKPKFWQGNVEKKIETAVTDGYGAMPPLNLSLGDVKAIIDYLSHTFKK